VVGWSVQYALAVSKVDWDLEPQPHRLQLPDAEGFAGLLLFAREQVTFAAWRCLEEVFWPIHGLLHD